MSLPGAHRSAGSRRAGHYWPTPEQVLLLRAALLPGDAALEAWSGWKAAVDPERLDTGSERLLPLLTHNLRRWGVRDPRLGRYEGLLRYTWVTNRLRITRLAPVVAALHRSGIPAMLLKGMALVCHHYRHVGLRPMDDVDLLVPMADVRRAVELLTGLGWRTAQPAVDLSTAHSLSLLSTDGGCLDLHWHALWESCGAGADDELWAHAAAGEFSGTPIRVIAPGDLLLLVLVHGARWNPVPPIRWVADAMTILTSDEAVDWPRFVAQARAHALVLPVRQALAFLAETFEAPVPADVVTALDSHRASAFERVEQRMREWTSPRLGCFPLVLCHHVRLTRAEGPIAVVSRLPRYLQSAYGLPTLRALPGALCARAARRLGFAAGTAT